MVYVGAALADDTMTGYLYEIIRSRVGDPYPGGVCADRHDRRPFDVEP